MKHLTQEEYDRLMAEAAEGRRLKALVNTPELLNFMAGVPLEAVHQQERWGAKHDGGKTPEDWYWLIGHLAGRALAHHKEAERLNSELAMAEDWDHVFRQEELSLIHSNIAHHREKAVHHCVTTAAAMANWHAAVLGKTNMRPDDPKEAMFMLGNAVAPRQAQDYLEAVKEAL